MNPIADAKDHTFPAHNALNTDTVKKEQETETESADRRMNEIANKAAAQGTNREKNYESGEIFSK
jgi:hypothetical protein